MGNSTRDARLESVFCEEIDALLRCDVGDPALQDAQITRVELSPGGARARVWFIAGDVAAADRAFERARGFIRAQLAETLGLKRMPELVFRWDPVTRTLKEGT